MSTNERYGTEVWTGLQEVSYLVDRNICNYVSVGEVAAAAKVSSPTAKKYLEMLADGQHVARLKIGKRSFYRMVITNGEIA